MPFTPDPFFRDPFFRPFFRPFFPDLRDEIGHVRIGNRWYEYFCAQRRLDPMEEFQKLLKEYGASRPRPPFHKEARLMAGFGEVELLYLETGTN